MTDGGDGGGVKGEEVKELKLVLFARNPYLNFDAYPNNKYMFGPYGVLYLVCEASQ